MERGATLTMSIWVSSRFHIFQMEQRGFLRLVLLSAEWHAPLVNFNFLIRPSKSSLSLFEMPLTREEWNDFFDRFYALNHCDCSNYTEAVFQLVLNYVED